MAPKPEELERNTIGQVTVDDFEQLKVLGRGAFGKVRENSTKTKDKQSVYLSISTIGFCEAKEIENSDRNFQFPLLHKTHG